MTAAHLQPALVLVVVAPSLGATWAAPNQPTTTLSVSSPSTSPVPPAGKAHVETTTAGNVPFEQWISLRDSTSGGR